MIYSFRASLLLRFLGSRIEKCLLTLKHTVHKKSTFYYNMHANFSHKSERISKHNKVQMNNNYFAVVKYRFDLSIQIVVTSQCFFQIMPFQKYVIGKCI
jgi:hypothetical protein